MMDLTLGDVEVNGNINKSLNQSINLITYPASIRYASTSRITTIIRFKVKATITTLNTKSRTGALFHSRMRI